MVVVRRRCLLLLLDNVGNRSLLHNTPRIDDMRWIWQNINDAMHFHDIHVLLQEYITTFYLS